MKIRIAPIVSACAIVLTVGAANAATMSPSGYLEVISSATNVEASQISTTKICWKKDCWRSEEYSVRGMRVTIKKGNDLFQYSPQEKMAIKIPIKTVSVERLMTEMLKPYELGAKVGSTTVCGMHCDIRKIAVKGSAAKGLSATAAVSTNPQFAFPMKSEMKQGTLSEKIEVREIKLNLSVKDSLFTLPQGTKIIQPKAMPGKIPGGRKAHKK